MSSLEIAPVLSFVERVQQAKVTELEGVTIQGTVLDDLFHAAWHGSKCTLQGFPVKDFGREEELFMANLRTMSRLNHPGVIRLLGVAVVTDTEIAIENDRVELSGFLPALLAPPFRN